MAEMMVASIYYNSSKWLGLSSGGRLHINIHIIYIRIYTCSSRCAWCDLNWLMWWNVRCIRFTHTHTTHRHTFCAAVASCCIQIFWNWLHANHLHWKVHVQGEFQNKCRGKYLLSPVNSQPSIKDIMIINGLGSCVRSLWFFSFATFLKNTLVRAVWIWGWVPQSNGICMKHLLHCSYNEVNI